MTFAGRQPPNCDENHRKIPLSVRKQVLIGEKWKNQTLFLSSKSMILRGKTNSGNANFSLKFLYVFHLIIGSINIYKTSAAKTNKNRISPTAMIVMSRRRSFEGASHRYTPIKWSTVLLRERFFRILFHIFLMRSR